MNLRELLESVREQNVPKTRLEELYQEFLNLYSNTELRIATLEKAEALFMEKLKEETVASGRRSWRATPEGQELIDLKRQSKVLEKQLSAVKHRIFSVL